MHPPTRLPAVVSVLAVPLLAAACGDRGGGRLSDAPLLTATQDLRIGSVDDAATALTWIRAMAVHDRG